MRTPAMPDGLRSAYLTVLGPAALLAPLPLVWTRGATVVAVTLYETALVLLLLRARAGRPVRLSNAILNAIGLSYFFWLTVETVFFRPGLLRSVSHLLLFTTIAKLASLKRPSEARTALLVIFLMVLASVSSSTHVASLVYCAVMAVLAFRTLNRLAVLADFEEEPPPRVLEAVPTRGLSVAAIAGGALLGVPLFFVLPRLHGPYALSPIRLDDAQATAVATDRVDLDAFGNAKISDRVVLRIALDPPRALPELLRLREAVFTEYRAGVWTRGSSGRRAASAEDRGVRLVGGDRLPGGERLAHLSIDQNLLGSGFLFLPYRASHVRVERARAVLQPDGVVQVSSSRVRIRYEASVGKEEARGPGSASIDPASVRPAIRDYAWKLTGDLTDPAAIANRIVAHFRRGFLYTLNPPRSTSDPIENFLLRSHAGHCEYFASAAAMMLAARGVPARLVTGSYGGEVGAFSDVVVVRGTNLHAWVEADFDGTGFQIVEPTPPEGVPAANARVSWWKRLITIGREIEVFYDRRILGFEPVDQAQITDALRESVRKGALSLDFLKGRGGITMSDRAKALVTVFGLVAIALIAWRGFSRRKVTPPATRAYLALRRLVARKEGRLAPAVPPAEVARLLEARIPDAGADARAVVDAYCASAFGGRVTDREAARELRERLGRLKKLA